MMRRPQKDVRLPLRLHLAPLGVISGGDDDMSAGSSFEIMACIDWLLRDLASSRMVCRTAVPLAVSHIWFNVGRLQQYNTALK